MGIETRNGHEYYYRKVRRGDRVCSRHIASGPFARYALLYDIVKRIEADEARDKEDAMLAADQAAERKHIEAFNQVDDVLDALLIGAGFHRHDRGEWRRRNNGKRAGNERGDAREPDKAGEEG